MHAIYRFTLHRFTLHRFTTPSTRQSGSSLFEALIASLVLAIGMLALARSQGTLRLDAELAHQRSDAVRLAQQELELVRGQWPFAAIASTSRQVDASTHFLVARDVTVVSGVAAKAASVTVSWTDRSGIAQRIALHSIMDGTDSALSGALALGSTPAATAPR